MHSRRCCRRLQSRKTQGSRTNDEWMQQHTHEGSTWRWPCHAIGTAPAEDRGGNCGCWPHTPRAGFHRLLCTALAQRATVGRDGTAQRPIRLEGKVSARDAALFPGQGHFYWPIPLQERRRVDSLLWRREVCRCKLGRAHRIRMKLMAQFQAEVPHPLTDDLPCLLSAGGMTTPAIRVLL